MKPLEFFVAGELVAGVDEDGKIMKQIHEEYTKKAHCYILSYLLLFIGCIGVQFGLNGSLIAAILWILSDVSLILILILFRAMKSQTLQKQIRAQTILLLVSLLLQIAAVILIIIYPVLYDYRDKNSLDYEVQNFEGLELKYYDKETCQVLIGHLEMDEYTYYYGYQCDQLLELKRYITGYAILRSYYTDYQFCQDAFSFYANEYEEKFGIYCNSVLGFNNLKKLSASLYSQRIFYQSGNHCLKNGFYDLYKEYCYPLQYGMMGYAVGSLLVFIAFFALLFKRISLLYNAQFRPAYQQQPNTLNTRAAIE